MTFISKFVLDFLMKSRSWSQRFNQVLTTSLLSSEMLSSIKPRYWLLSEEVICYQQQCPHTGWFPHSIRLFLCNLDFGWA